MIESLNLSSAWLQTHSHSLVRHTVYYSLLSTHQQQPLLLLWKKKQKVPDEDASVWSLAFASILMNPFHGFWSIL
ncbi:hypothetical protein VNO80_27157 [Phaseolus coccineus]|uniref:Uncharacterized protein n=1 Tax=Phaseolus coccineus TaxID=3886 RepID=A0AAN9LG25_PHACN